MELQSAEINEIATAMVKVQGSVKGAFKDGENPHFHSSFASLGSVWDACRESLQKNGVAVIQGGITIDGVPNILCTLVHTSGQWIRGVLPIVLDANPQKVGSAVTYYRRYLLASMVGVVTTDDDGEQAAGNKSETEGHQFQREQCLKGLGIIGDDKLWDAWKVTFKKTGDRDEILLKSTANELQELLSSLHAEADKRGLK